MPGRKPSSHLTRRLEHSQEVESDSFENRLRAFANSMSDLRDDLASKRVPEMRAPADLGTPSPAPAAVAAVPEPPAATSPLAQRVERLAADLARAGRRARGYEDSEAIHDLRVTARRLIATLKLWRDLFRDGSRRRALRRLKSIRRRLGPAREFEVHIEMLEGLDRPETVAGQAALDFLLLDTRRRLAQARRRVLDRVRPGRLRSLIAILERTSGRIDERLVTMPAATERARTRASQRAQEA